MTFGVDAVGRLQQIGQRLRPRDLLDEFDPFLVLDTLGLHHGHRFTAGTGLLGVEHLPRILQGRLQHRQHIDGIGLGLPVEQLDGGQSERRQRLVQGEVSLQVVDHAQVVTQHSRGHQRLLDRCRALNHRLLLSGLLIVVGQQVQQCRLQPLGAVCHVEHHRVVDVEAGLEDLRLGRGHLVERAAVPVRNALRRLLARDPAKLLGVVPGLGQQPLVLDLVLRGLHHHVAARVEARTARAAGDLMELPGSQHPHPPTVELHQGRDQHRSDRHVDPHPQCVGAAHDLQEPGPGQLLDQTPVSRQHARVVDADSMAHQAAQGAAESGGEAKAPDLLGDGALLLAGADIQAHQCLRTFQGPCLRGMDDVDRSLALVQQDLDRLMDRRGHIFELQRHRPFPTGDHRRWAPGASGEIGGDARGVPEGGRHEQELRAGQFDERHLPGPAAVAVAVVVELVHADQPHIGVGAFPQCEVGQHLGGCTDDRGIGVDGRVTGQHPHPVGTEQIAQVEELLGHQRLDRCGVEGTAPLPKSEQRRPDSDQALPGSGRGTDDRVRSRGQFEQRVLLRRIQRSTALRGPGRELFQQFLRLPRGQQIRQTGFSHVLDPCTSAAMPAGPRSAQARSCGSSGSARACPCWTRSSPRPRWHRSPGRS